MTGHFVLSTNEETVCVCFCVTQMCYVILVCSATVAIAGLKFAIC